MTFTQSVKSVICKNYANFSGRASRSEFWWFFLFTFLIGLAFELVFGFDVQDWPVGITSVYGLISLALIIPSIAVQIRRLHDIGKGGGWIFIVLVPLIGVIWYLVLMLTPSNPGDNRFGPQPY